MTKKEAKKRKFKLTYRDVTSEGLVQELSDNYKSASLRSSEGAELFSGRGAIKDFAKINAIWSGDSLMVDRKTGKSILLEGARLTVSVMVQNQVFVEFMKKYGDGARGSGFLSRFLVCRPCSTQGKRFITGDTPSWEKMNNFNEKVREFLDLNYERM